MMEDWSNYLLHLYQNHRVLFGCYSVLFLWVAGVTLKAVTRWPLAGKNGK